MTEWSTFHKPSQIWERMLDFCAENEKCTAERNEEKRKFLIKAP